MTHPSRPRLAARMYTVVVTAALAACGPEKSGSTDSTTTTDASATTEAATATGPSTATAPSTTAAPLEKCADAKTAAECATATEMDLDVGAGCRWGELRVATFPQAGMCSLEVVGGVCVLATFDEGGPGCFGFYRETGGGVIEMTEFGCGSPWNDDTWQPCFDAPMASPAALACDCLNPGG